MLKRITLPCLIVALLLPLLTVSPAVAGDELRIKIRADLYGHPIMEGKAVYKERIKDGETRRKLVYKIEYAPPFQTYAIHVNGLPRGFVTTNMVGEGKLKLEDGAATPLHPQDLVTIGPLSGVAMDRSPGTPSNSQRYRTRADLEGMTAASGDAKYREKLKTGGLRRDFKVEIEDAAANSVFTVFANGLAVAEITTNSSGRGEIHLRTPQFISTPGEADPMPEWFPTLFPGDVITVGPVSGVLELD
jgi:hypothetical protein